MNYYLLLRPEFAWAGALAAVFFILLNLRRGRRVWTPYLDLWQRALAQSSLWERAAQWLPGAGALFTAAGIAFAGLAASRPVHRQEGPRDLYLCLDESATSLAVENGQTRLQAAKDRALEYLQKARPGDRFGIITVGGDFQALQPLTSDLAAVRAAIGNARPRARRWNKVYLPILEALDAPAVLFTDNASNFAVDRSAGSRLRIESTGGAVDNAGIVDFNIQDPFPENEVRVRVHVKWNQHAPARRVLECLQKNTVVASESLPIESAGDRWIDFIIPRGPGGILQFRLTPADAFEMDDSAAVLVEEPASAPLVMIQKSGATRSPFLEAAARAIAIDLGIPLAEADSAASAPPGSVILQNGGDAGDFAQGILFGASSPEIALPRPSTGNDITQTLQISRRHPLLEGLLLQPLIALPVVELADGVETLVTGTSGPSMGIYHKNGRRVVCTSFTIEKSNLALLQMELPVLLRRAFVWCARGESRCIPFVRVEPDPSAPWRGVDPMFAPPGPGPCEIGGRPAFASLLDESLVNIDARPASFGEPLPAGPPVDDELSKSVALAAAAAFALALALEGFARAGRVHYRYANGTGAGASA